MFHYLSPGRCVCTRGATARKRVLIAWVGGCLQPAECGQADARASLPGGAWSSATAPAPCGRPPSATCRLLSAACRLPSAGCRLSARPRDRAPDAAAWAQGDVLQAEGEPCEHMFCVADGEVRRFRKEGQSTVEVRRIADQHAVAHLPARPMQMDTLGREDTTSTFGILHLARNEPYFATARAMTGGKVYTLSSADFNDLIGAPCSSSRRSWVALTPRCWCRSQPDHRAGVAAQSEHGAAPTVPRCVSRRPPTG